MTAKQGMKTELHGSTYMAQEMSAGSAGHLPPGIPLPGVEIPLGGFPPATNEMGWSLVQLGKGASPVATLGDGAVLSNKEKDDIVSLAVQKAHQKLKKEEQKQQNTPQMQQIPMQQIPMQQMPMQQMPMQQVAYPQQMVQQVPQQMPLMQQQPMVNPGQYPQMVFVVGQDPNANRAAPYTPVDNVGQGGYYGQGGQNAYYQQPWQPAKGKGKGKGKGPVCWACEKTGHRFEDCRSEKGEQMRQERAMRQGNRMNPMNPNQIPIQPVQGMQQVPQFQQMQVAQPVQQATAAPVMTVMPGQQMMQMVPGQQIMIPQQQAPPFGAPAGGH